MADRPTSDEELALAIYRLMGGRDENWERETEDFRQEYLAVAKSVMTPPMLLPVSDHCGNCKAFTVDPRFDCPCDLEPCPLADGFVCRACYQAIKRNIRRASGGEAE